MRIVLHVRARLDLAYDSLNLVAELETLTARAIKANEVTHQHPEDIAGGVAVAHAAAIAAKARLTGTEQDLLSGVLDLLEEKSLVRKGIEKARKITTAEEAAYVLGQGGRRRRHDGRDRGRHRRRTTTGVDGGTRRTPGLVRR